MSAYHNNKGIREEIDRLLKRNARRQANLGLDSTDEEKLRAAKLLEDDVTQIAKLDPQFAESLHAQDQ